MPIDSPRTLFLHDLASMYDAEIQLLEVLPTLAAETAPDSVSDAFTLHAHDTEHHAQNLRRCFQLLAVEPLTVTNHAVRGLKEDHDAFVRLRPSRDALIAFNLSAAAKTEQLEIAAYIGLLRQAHTLGLTDVAALLAENLRVEQITLSTVEKLADALSRGQRDERGNEVEAFRLSDYSDFAIPMPVVQDGTVASVVVDARPSAEGLRDPLGSGTAMPPARDARR
jgi:ferritin-like metal-binding protein YciE